jgi:hypothetical protein
MQLRRGMGFRRTIYQQPDRVLRSKIPRGGCRSQASDGRLVLPTGDDEAFGFVPLVVSAGGCGAHMSALAGPSAKLDQSFHTANEIAIG